MSTSVIRKSTVIKLDELNKLERNFWTAYMGLSALVFFSVIIMTIVLLFQSRDRPWSGSVDNIYFETDGPSDPVCRTGQYTFSESEAFAKSKGGRLCTVSEV